MNHSRVRDGVNDLNRLVAELAREHALAAVPIARLPSDGTFRALALDIAEMRAHRDGLHLARDVLADKIIRVDLGLLYGRRRMQEILDAVSYRE